MARSLSLRQLGSIVTRRSMYNPLVDKGYFPAYDPKTEHPFQALNQVKDNQKYFKLKGNDDHVYRRGEHDLIWYRGLMAISLGCVAFMCYDLYRMAIGNLPKKERS